MSTLHSRKRAGQRRVYMLVGPIASGKSTWVDQFLGDRRSPGAVTVSDDAIYRAVHGGHYGLYEKELKLLYKSIENHILATGIALGRDVIVDRPHVSVEGRKRVLGIAAAFDVPVIAVVFPVVDEETHAYRRFVGDSRGYDLAYWAEVARRQLADYEPPTLNEGFDSIQEA